MITDLLIDEGRKADYYRKGYWDDRTLNDMWNATVEQFGDREYVSDDRGQRFTYKEVDDKASRLASWFKEIGIENGDVISWQVPIWADFTYVYVAALKVGAVMHPLPRNFNEEDLTYVMNVVESKAFITPTFYWKTDYEQQMKNFIANVPTIKGVALMDKDAPVKDKSYKSVAEILETYEPLTEKPESKSDEVACILSTSGTTGKPKQVLLTHNNLKFSERVYVKGVQRTKADSENSWTIDRASLGEDCDLSVKNPNKVEEVDERTPSEIAQSIYALNSENQTLINEIMEMVK